MSGESGGYYADVNGLKMYYEIHGEGSPLVVLHGAFMTIGAMGAFVSLLAETRRVVAVELQGHGHTADVAEKPTAVGVGLAQARPETHATQARRGKDEYRARPAVSLAPDGCSVLHLPVVAAVTVGAPSRAKPGSPLWSMEAIHSRSPLR